MEKDKKDQIEVLFASALESIRVAKENEELSNSAIVELLHVEDVVRKLYKLFLQN